MTFIKEPPETGEFCVGSRVWFVFTPEGSAGTITGVDHERVFPYHVYWDDDGTGEYHDGENTAEEWYNRDQLRLIVPIPN